MFSVCPNIVDDVVNKTLPIWHKETMKKPLEDADSDKREPILHVVLAYQIEDHA